MAAPDLSELRLRDRPEWPPLERLRHEFEALGFYLSAHPLDGYGRTLERLGVVPVERLAATIAQQRGDAARVKVAGVVVSAKLRTSARGNRFAFVALTDQSGVSKSPCFPRCWRKPAICWRPARRFDQRQRDD